MKSKIISYNIKGLTKTDASKLSKLLIGYKDKSNNGAYEYQRKGLVTSKEHIILGRSVFIVLEKDASLILKTIEERKGLVKMWDVDIPKKYFKS